MKHLLNLVGHLENSGDLNLKDLDVKLQGLIKEKI